MPPKIGALRMARSHDIRPSGVPVHTRQARTPTSTTTRPTHQYCCSAALTARRICVGSGIAWLRSLKIVAKRGMTKVIRNTTAPAPTSVMTVG
jgi:hypothetical protein